MNQDTDSELLRCRLERLERAHRRYRRIGGALLLVATLPLAAFVLRQDPKPAAPGSDTLQVHKLEITDEKGDVVAHFGMNEEGRPELLLRDPQKRKRVLLQIAKKYEEPALFIRDEEEMNRLTLIVDAAGNPHVVLSEKGQKPRAQLTVSERGAPSLSFRHRDGGLYGGIGLHADGKPWIIPEAGAGEKLPEPVPLPVESGDSKAGDAGKGKGDK